jgi:hypothetical protein
MTDNHRSVIGDITHGLTNAEKQASWRERHPKNEKWNQVARSVHFRRQHQGAAQADRLSQGLLGDVCHQGVGGER